MPQLDYLTNLSFFSNVLAIHLFFILIYENYHTDFLLPFWESVVSFYMTTPVFIPLLTYKVYTFFWANAQEHSTANKTLSQLRLTKKV